MTTDSNPPVGATVVDADGDTYQLVGRDGYRVWQDVGYSPPRYVEECQEPLLAALWRMQQRAEQAEAAAHMWMREVRERDVKIAALVEDRDAAFAARNVAQGNADDAEAELAKFRALAVEAKAVPGCGNHSCRIAPPSGMGTNGGCSCHDKPHGRRALTIVGRLAALATPNLEPTQ